MVGNHAHHPLGISEVDPRELDPLESLFSELASELLADAILGWGKRRRNLYAAQ
jgi:hypothetical protein